MVTDIKGKEIKVGSNVVFGMGGSMQLLHGVVKKINPATVAIRYSSVAWHWKDGKSIPIIPPLYNEHTSLRTFANVVVVE